MKPLGLNEAGFVKHAKKTRKATFLAEMNEVEPWSRRMALIDPDDPKAGNGRRPIGLERMRRIHVMPPWFAYADPAMPVADASCVRWVCSGTWKVPLPGAPSFTRPVFSPCSDGPSATRRSIKKVRSRGLAKNTPPLPPPVCAVESVPGEAPVLAYARIGAYAGCAVGRE